jgi:hypothetical protein
MPTQSARQQWKVALVRIGAFAFFFLPVGSDASRASAAQCPVPARPWEFLDATSQIEFIPDTTGTRILRAVQSADFDHDGALDVVIAQAVSAQGVAGSPYRGVLYMNEAGRFVDRTEQYLHELLTPEVRWWSVLHDFAGPNGAPDGWADVYVGGGGGLPSRFFRNLGAVNGVWQGFVDESWRIQGPSAVGTDSYYQEDEDLDGDGLVDVVEFANGDGGASDGQIRVLMNRNGMFVDETEARLPRRAEPSLFGEVEDFNGDGLPDISVANLSPPAGVPQIRVLINDGTGKFPVSLEQRVQQPVGNLGVYGLETLDVNGDDKEDIYALNFGKAGNSSLDAVLLNLGADNALFNTVSYPKFPNGSKDSDGDQPVSADLDGDGRNDVVVAQFATKTFVLRNRTCDGVTSLVEQTPPEVPSGSAYRASIFDANGDGVPDVWIGRNQPNVGHFLMIGNVPEQEPNATIARANVTTTFPALRTGVVQSSQDLDVFGLPSRAVDEGARLMLEPAADADLQLALLDASGTVLAISDVPGTGSPEEIRLSAGSNGKYVRVEQQGALGSGTYRLSIVPSAAGGDLSPDRVPDGKSPQFPATRGPSTR